MKLNLGKKLCLALISTACAVQNSADHSAGAKVSSADERDQRIELSCASDSGNVQMFAKIAIASATATSADVELQIGEVTPSKKSGKLVISQQEEFMNYNIKFLNGDFINMFMDGDKGEGPAQLNGELVILKCGTVQGEGAGSGAPQDATGGAYFQILLRHEHWEGLGKYGINARRTLTSAYAYQLAGGNTENQYVISNEQAVKDLLAKKPGLYFCKGDFNLLEDPNDRSWSLIINDVLDCRPATAEENETFQYPYGRSRGF